MSKIDKVKEELNWLKVLFAILVATLFSMVAWMAQNHQEAGIIMMLTGIGAVVVAVLLALVARYARIKINQLEEL
jgi:hypothetical protein